MVHKVDSTEDKRGSCIRVHVPREKGPRPLLAWLAWSLFNQGLFLSLHLCSAYVFLGPVLLGHIWGPLIVLAVCLIQYLIPPAYGTQWPHAYKTSKLLRTLVSYFDMELVMEERLDTSKRYMFGMFPHAAVPLATMMCLYFLEDILPGQKIPAWIHSKLFNIPFVRFMWPLIGAVGATPGDIRRVRHELDTSGVMVVGGVAEMLMQSGAERELIRMRKGFLREALRNGYDLVPVFNFGATKLYKYAGPASLFQLLTRFFHIPTLLFYGRWGTWVPRQSPLKTAIGKSFSPAALVGRKEGEEIEEPTQEQVDKVYDHFKTQITKLYYAHRPSWETRDLQILDTAESFKTY